MNSLIETINKFNGKKILVVGDLMLDYYIIGECSRISPEAPVPIINVTNTRYVLGGAGNVANNLASLGAKPILIGILGNDLYKAEFKSLLTGIHDETLALPKAQTALKARIIGSVASPQQIVRYDIEKKFEMDAETENVILNKIEQLIKIMDAVIISDYNKGMFGSTLAQRIIMLANRHNKPTIVDPKPENIEKFSQASLVCPNFREAEEIAGQKHLEFNIKNLCFIAKAIQKKFGITYVIITCGKHGAFYYEDEKNFNLVPTKVKAVYDVSGAGDTAAATIALSISAGACLYDACCLANKAGSIVICKQGTATLTLEELKGKLKENEGGIV
ncbi:bifunctional hydroxymethylpyrimidine kinase/phosphomethylpyrimidine kinase [archaeon]|nr:bifunctional hydroxymethylpyrimidine kinase/phosphomethylpyrimidine kinase [archaeon]